MARVYPLFSSSKGNSTFIGTPQSGILIDAGVSCKKIVEALEYNKIGLDAVKAVFITHEHSDHIKGLSVFTKKTKVPVFARKKTLKYICNKNCICPQSNFYIIGDEPVDLAEMKICSFQTPHDSEQSCGYSITTYDGKKIVVCTDLGEVTATVDENLLGSDLVLIESNYDEQMLKNGPYPYFLKNRISSCTGHLSNNDCAKQVRKLIHNGTTRIILGHLSQENNSPKVAEAAVLSELTEFERDKDYILKVAPVNNNGMVLTI